VLKLIDSVRTGSPMQRLYALAFTCGVMGIIISALLSQSLWAEGLLVLAGILFGLGFCFRITPILKRIWSSSVGKWAIGGLNVAVWFLAHVPARLAVAKALGLPPQDFDVTVSIWTVATYPAVWIAFVSFLTLVICTALMLTFLVLHLSSFPLITESIDFLSHLLPSSIGNRLTTEKRREVSTRYLAHVAGSAMLGIASAVLLQATSSIHEHCLSAIPWIAYVADYQETPAYPGIQKNQRVRLHENGVVSYAVREGGAVRIHVRAFSPSQ
jgi:hypothetical protein